MITDESEIDRERGSDGMRVTQAPTGRRAARLSLIDAERNRLVTEDATANDDDWNEASAFHLAARNARWHELADERRTTLAA